MFGKRRCNKCGEKVERDHLYCPYCKNQLKDISNEEDWGLLGKDDSIEPEEMKLPIGLNTLFNSLLKNLNNQMKEMDNGVKQTKDGKISKKSGGISISISTSGDKPPEIKVRSFGNAPGIREKEQKILEKTSKIKLPVSESGKFSGLPKKEPETNIRRFSNKVVYEINMPGVKDVKDVSIIQLENSIEIKALSGKKVFYKIIPISLPISNYNLSGGVLTLELDSRE